MTTLQLILYIAALILFGLAAIGVGGRIHCGWAGAFCAFLAWQILPLLG